MDGIGKTFQLQKNRENSNQIPLEIIRKSSKILHGSFNGISETPKMFHIRPNELKIISFESSPNEAIRSYGSSQGGVRSIERHEMIKMNICIVRIENPKLWDRNEAIPKVHGTISELDKVEKFRSSLEESLEFQNDLDDENAMTFEEWAREKLNQGRSRSRNSMTFWEFVRRELAKMRSLSFEIVCSTVLLGFLIIACTTTFWTNPVQEIKKVVVE